MKVSCATLTLRLHGSGTHRQLSKTLTKASLTFEPSFFIRPRPCSGYEQAKAMQIQEHVCSSLVAKAEAAASSEVNTQKCAIQ